MDGRINLEDVRSVSTNWTDASVIILEVTDPKEPREYVSGDTMMKFSNDKGI